MSKRPGDIIISTPVSKVRRRLNFDSPYTNRVVAPTVRVTRSKIWANRPMYRKPKLYRMYRSPDVPKGCEGPCKVQSYEQRDDVKHIGMVRCVSDVTRGSGITHRVGKRFCVKSIYILGKIWMDENIKKQNHTNHVMFFLVRDRRPYGPSPQDFGQVFNMFDNEPTTATVKNDLRDRYQVLRKFYATVVGGPSGMKEQALVKRFFRINNHVVYNHQNRPSMRIILRMRCYCIWHVHMPQILCTRL
uniref:Capsid protein n=1 Tax=East African cassava mosaic virus-Kenya TaxID=1229189 RepID=I6LZB4_9GEMI|nr:coat protein [East African cassava mosaic virus-Kenya]